MNKSKGATGLMDGGRTDAQDPKDPLIGRVINERFEIVRHIGQGGAGTVYLAMQAPFDRPCALKVLRPRFQGDLSDDFHRRFFLEASTAAKLQHPNNVAIFDYGRTDEGMYFMAMEYLEGRTLQDAIREEGPFDEERTTHIARQVCRALREAHHHHVIHRDIKPSNIFLLDRHDEKDVVKVLDFGLVKQVKNEDAENLTQANFFMGSPKYVSPEQIEGASVDVRTDIYALGVVMYEMVTGHVPYDLGATVKTLIAHIKDDVPPLRSMNPTCDVTPLFEHTILRCLAKDPAERVQSMGALLEVLKHSPAASLTSTLMEESGRAWLVDSGPLALSGSAPQPTTVTAPHGTTAGGTPSIEERDDRFSRRARRSWARRHGKTTLAGGAVLAAVVATVFVMGQRGRAPAENAAIHAGSASLEAPGSGLASAAEAVAPAPAELSAEVSEPKAPEPERVVELSVHPSNAKVRLTDGTELCSGAPCPIPASRFEDGALIVTVASRGYLTRKQKLAVDEGEVEVRLRPIRVRATPQKTAAPAVTTTTEGTPFGEMPPY